jgi:hypothetical protein
MSLTHIASWCLIVEQGQVEKGNPKSPNSRVNSQGSN